MLSLDQCADQYVLAWPEADLRLLVAGKDDGFMDASGSARAGAGPPALGNLGSARRVVVTLPGARAAPAGGAGEAQDTQVLAMYDATDMAGVRENLRSVSQGWGERAARLIALMDGGWPRRRAARARSRLCHARRLYDRDGVADRLHPKGGGVPPTA